MRSTFGLTKLTVLALCLMTTCFMVSPLARAQNQGLQTLQTIKKNAVIRTQPDCYGCVETLDENGDKASSRFDISELENELAALLSTTGELNLSIKSMGFDRSCHGFSKNLELGKWGRYVLELLDPVQHANLLNGSADLEQNCPRYRNMSNEQRKHVWVLIVSAMSYLESSCTQVGAQGPNGTAFGYLQLHLDKEGKYSSSCRDGDSKNPQKTFRCGLGMLDDQIARDGELFSNNSYWDVLRKNGTGKFKIIQNAVRNYQLCNQTTKVKESKSSRSAAR